MNAAHGGEAIAARKRRSQAGIDLRFIRFLVGDNAGCDNCVRLWIMAAPSRDGGVLERVGDVSQPVEALLDVSCSSRRASASLAFMVERRQPRPDPSARKALRMTATSMASCVKAPSTGVTSLRPPPASQRPTSPFPRHALECDGVSPASDLHRVRHAIELIDENHDVRRLGRGAGPARAHGDADMSRRERRRVVDAVADHQGRAQRLLDRDRRDLVGRIALGQHGIKVEGGADRLRRLRPVAGDHDDPRHPQGAQ